LGVFDSSIGKRGFGEKWITWIRQTINRGPVGVTVNNKEGEFFEIGKGLRQGTPCPPFCLI
jgi:hypothetical protein